MDSVVSIEIPGRELAAGEVHVWSMPLDMGLSSVVGFQESLSLDESKRVDRFRFEAPRNRFIVGRGLLRVILGRYCDVSPERLRFSYGPNGKPELALDEGARRAGGALHFNLAHSEGVGVLAITQAAPVGVDVELIRRLPEVNELVSQFFSAREAAEFSRLPWEQQPVGVFQSLDPEGSLAESHGRRDCAFVKPGRSEFSTR